MDFTIGDRVEWLTRPMRGGYLQGTVLQIRDQKVKIEVFSPVTGERKVKWAFASNLRKVEVA